MFADVLNDCVMLVELAAPLLPRPLVLPVLCGAGVGRSLVGVAGGATKAAVAQHQVEWDIMYYSLLSEYKLELQTIHRFSQSQRRLVESWLKALVWGSFSVFGKTDGLKNKPVPPGEAGQHG